MFSRNNKKNIIRFAFIVLLFFLLIFFATQIGTNESMRNALIALGYPGFFLISFVSGFNVVVPLPAASLIPLFVEVGLNFWILVILATIGMALGDTVGYLAGFWGRSASKERDLPVFFQKLERKLSNYRFGTTLFVFLYGTFVPLPNEVIVIPLAYSGVAYHRIIIPLAIGNIFFNTAVGLGVTSLITIVG